MGTDGDVLRVSQLGLNWLLDSENMAVIVEETPGVGADKVHALVQLLRSRSYEEIRQRMYDNPPGSPWWSACKTELEIRNSEKVAASLSASARLQERMTATTQHFELLTETLQQTTSEIADLLKTTQAAG